MPGFLRSLAIVAIVVLPAASGADETCQSPYLPKVTGHEDYVYVWTLGMEGVGDGSDKLVTVGAHPDKPHYGKVVSSISVGGRHEAHHGGFSDDRRHLWLGGLDDSRIFVFDVHSDPARPELVKRIDDFVEKTDGVVGPHTFYALPGRMLISGLSNAKDWGGKTALAEYSNEGDFIRTLWLPDDAAYGYDVRVNAALNRMLTSSFTGHKNYMRKITDLLGDAEAMQHFGNTMVLWDFHARKPLQIFEVPGAPLEIRWALQPRHHYAFTSTLLAGKLWGVFRKDDGTFEAVELATIGEEGKSPLPVDISLSSDDRYLFVDSFGDGMVRVYDVSQPRKPKKIHEKKIGSHVNMVSQSWDGERVYFTSSVLSQWDTLGTLAEGSALPDPDADHFLKAYGWDGKELEPTFAIDFLKEGLGRPHIMRFGAEAFGKGRVAEGPATITASSP